MPFVQCSKKDTKSNIIFDLLCLLCYNGFGFGEDPGQSAACFGGFVMESFVSRLSAVITAAVVTACLLVPLVNQNSVWAEPVTTPSFDDAALYRVCTDQLDLDEAGTYPQKVRLSREDDGPYDLEILVKSPDYSSYPSVHISRYNCPEEAQPYLEPTALVQSDWFDLCRLAGTIAPHQTGVLDVAQETAAWVSNYLEADLSQEDSLLHGNHTAASVTDILASGSGSTCEYNTLFLAIMRAKGVPARMVAGCRFDAETEPALWSEVYCQGYGWVAVDPRLGSLGVPDNYIRLFAGTDYPDLGIPLSQVDAQIAEIF